MAESLPPLNPDTEPPAVLGKMEALIARHRGSGLDPNVPVLTDLDPAGALGEIPVLTHVEPVVGDDLMFTPEEIRAEAPSALDLITPPVSPPPAPVAPAPAPRLAPVPPPAAPPAPIDMIDVPQYAPSPKPAPAPTPAPAPSFDFPDLSIPTSKPVVAKPAASSPPSPLADGPLMPDLMLNFDFAPPPEETPVRSAPAPQTVAAPAPAPAAPRVAAPQSLPVAAAPAVKPPVPVTPAVRPAAVPTSPAVAQRPGQTVLVSDAFPDLSIELDEALAGLDSATHPAHPIAEVAAIDPVALTTELLASLRPELEKLVRAELARQVATLHAEVLKRTLGALQPQLDKLISSKIEEALRR